MGAVFVVVPPLRRLCRALMKARIVVAAKRSLDGDVISLVDFEVLMQRRIIVGFG